MLTPNPLRRLRDLIWSGLGLPTLSTITFDPLVTRSGQDYTFVARRDQTSAAETRTVTLAGSTAYSPAATAADFGGTFPSATATFAAGAATAPVTFTVPSTVQPE